jgi:hypothetical protein
MACTIRWLSSWSNRNFSIARFCIKLEKGTEPLQSGYHKLSHFCDIDNLLFFVGINSHYPLNVLLSPDMSASVLCGVIFKELYLGRTGLRDGAFLQIERPAEEVK